MNQDNNTSFLALNGLNYYDVKYNFINYLKKQSEFTDYNLEASNISILLDILAYNTSQQGFYNTMVANEMFIDRALKRSSVVSIAKLMGYTPQTRRASKAKVLVTVDADDLPESKIIPRGTVFTGSINSQNFSFTCMESYPFYPYTFAELSDPDSGDNGEILSYACGPIELKQGILSTISYNISKSDQILLIPDTSADKDTIRVVVLESLSDSTGVNIPWFKSTDITDINENSRVFFLEENNLGQLAIKFGDGILGKKVNIGNLVVIEYLSTGGESANGIGTLDTPTRRSFSTTNQDFTVLTLEPSNSGFEKENTTSIRKNAVRNYTSKNRAVTKSDYEGIVLASFNNNAAVRCWGGEENDPPFYGKVFVSVRPIGSTILTSEEKTNLIKNVLESKNIVGMDVVVVDPDVLYIYLDIEVFYEKEQTNDSITTINKRIKDSLSLYFRNALVEFGDSIFAQDIETEIKKSSSSIKAAEVKINILRKIQPSLNITEKLNIDFQNEINHPYDGYQPVIVSSPFYIASNLHSHFIEDDGYGNLVLKKKLNGITTIVNSLYGTVNYKTGKLTIPNFKVFAFPQGQTTVNFKAVPKSNNIFTSKNSILEFDILDNNSLKVSFKEVKTQKVVGGSGTVITNI